MSSPNLKRYPSKLSHWASAILDSPDQVIGESAARWSFQQELAREARSQTVYWQARSQTVYTGKQGLRSQTVYTGCLRCSANLCSNSCACKTSSSTSCLEVIPALGIPGYYWVFLGCMGTVKLANEWVGGVKMGITRWYIDAMVCFNFKVMFMDDEMSWGGGMLADHNLENLQSCKFSLLQYSTS